MVDPTAGTPSTPAQTANDAGTAPVVRDGSDAANPKPVDPALAMVWKGKAEKYNELEEQLAEARAQLERSRQAQMQAAQPDAQAQQAQAAWQRIQQDAAAGDAYAQLQIAQYQMTQQASAQAWLASEIAVLPEGIRATVRDIVMNSGFRVGIAEARKQAEDMGRGKQYDDLASRLKTLEEENTRLKQGADLARRTVSTSIVPAASPEPGSYDMTGSEYRAALMRGGPDAVALKRAVDSGQRRVDYTR